MKRLILSVIVLTLAGCAEPSQNEETASVDTALGARTGARRSRIERLSRVNALARLYVGHELTRDELVMLVAKSEAQVIASLVARPDFEARFAARLAEYRMTQAGGRAWSAAAKTDAPIVDAFDGDEQEASGFARFVVRSQAPAIGSLASAHPYELTYRELLDGIRIAAIGASKS